MQILSSISRLLQDSPWVLPPVYARQRHLRALRPLHPVRTNRPTAVFIQRNIFALVDVTPTQRLPTLSPSLGNRFRPAIFCSVCVIAWPKGFHRQPAPPAGPSR